MNVPWVDLSQISLKKIDIAKNMAAMGGASFHYIVHSVTLKIFFSKSAHWISLLLCMYVPWVDLFQIP